MKYPINDIFMSVQGEGTYSGMLMAFIRLGGVCPIKCAYCDTDTSQYEELFIEEIIEKITKLDGFSEDIPIYITGMEPLVLDIWLLLNALKKFSRKIIIKTSGVMSVVPIQNKFIFDISDMVFITDIKLQRPYWKEDLLIMLSHCSELHIHAVLSAEDLQAQVDKLLQVNDLAYARYVDRWISPVIIDNKVAQLPLKTIQPLLQNGWAISLQQHKFLGFK